jgi:hypothetical protein
MLPLLVQGIYPTTAAAQRNARLSALDKFLPELVVQNLEICKPKELLLVRFGLRPVLNKYPLFGGLPE